MSDTVTLDPGSGGAVVATDDAGVAGQVQIVKLAISADGSATVLPGDAANGLDVDVTRLPALAAGTNNIGDVDVLTIAAGDNNIGNVDVVTLPALAAGTNNIGDVDVLTLPAIPAGNNNIGDVDIASIAAGNNNIGDVDIASALPAGNNNIGDVDIASALPAGTNAIGKLAANSGVDIGDVDVTSIAAGTNAIGNVGLIPRTSGGMTALQNLDVDESEDAIKTSAGMLFGWYIYNDAVAEVYVKFYNDTVANVSVGSTTPLMTLAVPAGSAANLITDMGIVFSSAITVAATTAAAVADTGAPATNQVVATFFYQ